MSSERCQSQIFAGNAKILTINSLLVEKNISICKLHHSHFSRVMI